MVAMDNYVLPSVLNFSSYETLTKQVANLFKVSAESVTNQSVVEQENRFNFYETYRTQEKELSIVNKTVAYVIGTLIILSNLTVVISSGLILRRGQQPKSTYLLLGNVSLADTIIGIAIIFCALIDNAMSSDPMCIFQMGMLVSPVIVSIFSVGLIAVDRYFYILHGLYYQRYFKTTRVRIIIVIIWGIGLTLGFMPATRWVNNELKHTSCYYTALFPGALILFISILSLILITVVILLYFIILVRALRNIKDIKAARKSVSSNSSTNEITELRIYRGNTKNNKSLGSTLTKLQKCKMTKCASLNDLSINCYKKTFSKVSVQSKSISDLGKDNQEDTNDVDDKNDPENINKSYKSQYHDSKLSDYTIKSNNSDPNVLSPARKTESSSIKSIINQFCKSKSSLKPKEPNKWRAITVVMLTTGSFLVTLLPCFVTVILYIFCEEKLTNPNCFRYRTLLGGPLAALAFFNSILNPLIYAWWHKGFQKTVRTLAKKHWCLKCFSSPTSR